MCFGIVLAQFTNWALKQDYDQSSHDPSRFCVSEYNWKLQLTVGAAPSILLVAYAWFVLPETNHWLFTSGRVVRARDSLPSLSTTPLLPRGNADSVEVDSEGESSSESEFLWRDLFHSAEGFVHARIAIGLAMCVQITGINAIIYYSPHIFKDANIDNVLIVTFSVVGVWNFVTVFVATALIDRLGRRVLMIAGLTLMTVGAFSLGIAYAVFDGVAKVRFMIILSP